MTCMKRYTTLLTWLLCCLVTACLKTSATELNDKTIKILTPSWKNWTNPDGSGFYFDLLREIYTDEGYTLKIDITSFIRSLAATEKGDSDITIGSLYIGSEEWDFFTPLYPVDTEDFVIICKKALSWHSQKELEGIRLMIPRGYEIPEGVNFSYKRINIEDELKGIKMLAADREKYLLGTRLFSNDNIKQIGHNTAQYQITTVNKRYLYIAYTNNDRGKRLANIYDNKLPQLIKNGTLKKLYQKWHMPHAPLLSLPEDLSSLSH